MMKIKKLLSTVGMAASVFALSHTAAHAASNQYTVKSGDSLYRIGRAYHVSVNQLKSTNHLTGDLIRTGERLTIPVGVTSSLQTNSGSYTVKSGDTLYKIGRAYHVTVSALKSANHLTSDVLYIGQKLHIPGQSTSSSSGIYSVKSGDSLYKISRAHHVSISQLKSVNHLTSNVLYIGQTLHIPGVSTTQPSVSAGTNQSSNYHFSATQKKLLAQLVTAESQGQPYKAQVAIATVILNRIDSPKFPNTIEGVIYQKANGYYQFTPVKNGQINHAPTASCVKAVNEAIASHGSYKAGGALFFYNPSKTNSAWLKSLPVTQTIGATTFAL